MRFKLGLIFIVIGTVMPAFGLAVPLLHLPAGYSAAIIGFFIVGGPELFLLIGAALAGKQAVTMVKSRLFRPAGRARYYTGLFLFVGCFAANWIFAYLEVSGIAHVNNHAWLRIMAGLDVAALGGLLLMGPALFSKLKGIFVWEEETG